MNEDKTTQAAATVQAQQVDLNSDSYYDEDLDSSLAGDLDLSFLDEEDKEE